ncbi:MAG TPA: peptidoglycan-binding domain-containing protein [Dehalococcoidia bacterium]|nr:peptidoglycan-binding domain-containing protein [Dehalococcoidia bacterium]
MGTKHKRHHKKHNNAASGAQANPLNGRGMWIWYVSQAERGNLSSIVARARRNGVSTLMIKSGDGTSYWSQFSRGLVSALHRSGFSVCAWQFVYGSNPVGEAKTAYEAIRNGADCLMIDAEGQYEGKYVQAQRYVNELRSVAGSSYPLALAGFPYVDFHPGFPYSVFLGPGAAQYNAPQMYWRDIGTSVSSVYSHTYAFNRMYGRAIFPLGEAIADSPASPPPPSQIRLFRQVSRAYGAGGVSWWMWTGLSGYNWHALSQAVGGLRGFKPNTGYASVGSGAQGDLVVWAQEHLVSAGERIAIDGAFGPKTKAAVMAFQRAHGLPAIGLIGPSTWGALLRYSPAHVTWVTRGSRQVATVSGANVEPVPRSASLPAKRYEIPRNLGAGAPAKR